VGRRIAWLGVLSAGFLSAQQLQLAFDGHGTYTFALGEVIHVPEAWTLAGITISPEGDPDDVFIFHLNNTFVVRGGVRNKVKANPPAFMNAPFHILRLLKDTTTVAEWTVHRETQPNVEAELSAAAAAPDVRIDEPALRFIRPQGPEVRIAGSVVSEGDFIVRIEGREVERDVARDGWGFSASIPLPAEATAIEVAVEIRGVASRHRILLPVIR
jgi:hypothetical protein